MSAPKRGQPAKSHSKSQPSKVRKCTIVFVLGSGFDPSASAADLSADYQTAAGRGFDFSTAKPVVKAAKSWKKNDKLGFKLTVIGFIADWFAEHDLPFEEDRLVLRDYSDDAEHLFAVAGYFPRGDSISTPQRSASHQSPHEDDSNADEFEDSMAESPEPQREAADDEVIFDAAPTGAKFYLAKAVDFVKSQPQKRLVTAGAIVVGILLLLAGVPFAIGKVQDYLASHPAQEAASPDEDANNNENSKASKDNQKDEPKKAASAKFTTATIAVHTPEPGFHVLVDGEPVLNDDGGYVETPCAVTCEQGPRFITVFREGWIDATKRANVIPNSDVEFEPEQDDKNIGSEVLTAPYLHAKIGEPISLKGLNTNRPELDPFLTNDRLTIYFAGDRQEGRGIYVATRPTPYHDFETPKIVNRNPDLPATPSISEDGLFLLYTVPTKARLMLLKRTKATSDFGDRTTVRQTEKESVLWPSCQILGDGLRLYWTEADDGEFKTYSVSRKSPLADFDKTLKVRLPGEHACLSSDGLRQYDFDGQKLTRYRRPNLNTKFPETGDVIAEIDLPDIDYSTDYRQYFVTSDEQWLFYCDKPDDSGDIKMVRLSNGPQWGVKPTGKSISPKPKQIAKNEMQDGNTPSDGGGDGEKPMPKPKPIDPRTVPLPYTSFSKVFATLMSERKYDEAQALLDTNLTNDAFNPFKQLLDWDIADLKAIRGFWADIEKSLTEMPVGEPYRIGTSALKFAEFKDGIVVGKLGTAELKRPVAELAPADLSAFFDRLHKGTEPEPQLRFATFLAYDKQAVERQLKLRVERAGRLGTELLEQRARRKFALAKAEFERKNYGNGTAFITEAEALASPTSPIVTELAAMRAMLFTLVKWEPRGKREWVIEDGSYRATTERKENSLLVASEQFENFEISFEWQVENTVQSQGGVYFRYSGSGDIYENAYKIHLANDAGVKPDVYSSGALFAISAADSNPVKPAGEWNTTTIRVIGSTVTVTINGKQANKANLGSSKIPDKGLVCLDGGIGGITYRKVRLNELPSQ